MKGQANFRNMAVVCLTILVLGIPGLSNADDDSDISRIFIFGDSLSDSGNAYIQDGGVATVAPYTLAEIVPTNAYDIRGFQFSNGKTWAQKFAKHLELKRSGKASLRRPGRFTNYAFGGARARVFGDRPSALEQLGLYMQDFPGLADDDAVYVIQFGGNDLRDVLEGLVGTPDDIITAAIGTKAFVIQQLYQKGARNFLVANVPDISLAPAIRLQAALSSESSENPQETLAGILAGINGLVMLYNFHLESALVGLEQLPDISIKRLDFFGIINDIVFNPANYGISEVDSSCIDYFVAENQICDKPGKYVFWDGIHPNNMLFSMSC